MVICTIPIVFMQSVLGQFSSSGFISVFRMAPIFKGIGYVSLATNIVTLMYYSTYAAIPVFYFLHSLRPTLPWSCEGSVDWFVPSEEQIMACNLSNIINPSPQEQFLAFPSVDFLKYHLNIVPSYQNIDKFKLEKWSYSWPLLFCTLAIWIALWVILRKPTETIGRVIRYSTLIMVAILSTCVVRFGFLPGAFAGLTDYFVPKTYRAHQVAFFAAPLISLYSLGPGWATTLSMASYNTFKTDVTKYTWIICFGQFGLLVLTSFSWIFIENFLRHIVTTSIKPVHLYVPKSNRQWIEFLSIPTALSILEMPNVWTLLFFGMITLGAMNLLVTQLFSVLTALFDEFEPLRERRKDVLSIVVGVFCLVSCFFCSNYGITIMGLLSKYSFLSQISLNLMLILVVFWIYGRQRFQSDLHFMTGRTYSTWMVYIVRFITPIFLSISFLIGLIYCIFDGDSNYSTLFVMLGFALATVIIWLLVPGYCIYKIKQMRGLLGRRLRRSVRPTDWYPVDPLDRQRYEETFSNPDMSHQLTTTTE